MVVPRRAKVSKSDWKALEFVADSERDREGWLEARNTGLGASEVASVFGVNPWESPFTLYQKKLGVLPPQPDNERMEMGRRLEPVVADLFRDRTKREVWKHPLGGMLLRSREFPWLLATPDYEQSAPRCATNGLLECKTTGGEFAADWSEDVPVYYQIQVQQQLLVSGRKYASVACLIGGNRFLFKHVRRNEKFLKNLAERTRVFWDMVQSGTAPPVDASDSTIATLKQMREDGNVIHLSADVLVWHDRLVIATEQRKKAEEEEKSCKNQIASMLGLASRGLMPEGKGMYKFETKKGYSVKAHEVGPSRQLKFSERTDV